MTLAEPALPDLLPMKGAVISEVHVRDLDTTTGLTRLAGRAVPYNTAADVGPFTEEFTPGAFKRSIAQHGQKLPLLLFHNQRAWPIGVAEEWRDESDGLYGVWRLAEHPEAQEAGRMARDGMLNYMSITFQQDPGRYDYVNGREKPHFRRRSARLVETSLTATPVYPDSTVFWVRSTPAAVTGTPALTETMAWLDQIRNR